MSWIVGDSVFWGRGTIWLPSPNTGRSGTTPTASSNWTNTAPLLKNVTTARAPMSWGSSVRPSCGLLVCPGGRLWERLRCWRENDAVQAVTRTCIGRSPRLPRRRLRRAQRPTSLHRRREDRTGSTAQPKSSLNSVSNANSGRGRCTSETRWFAVVGGDGVNQLPTERAYSLRMTASPTAPRDI